MKVKERDQDDLIYVKFSSSNENLNVFNEFLLLPPSMQLLWVCCSNKLLLFVFCSIKLQLFLFSSVQMLGVS